MANIQVPKKIAGDMPLPEKGESFNTRDIMIGLNHGRHRKAALVKLDVQVAQVNPAIEGSQFAASRPIVKNIAKAEDLVVACLAKVNSGTEPHKKYESLKLKTNELTHKEQEYLQQYQQIFQETRKIMQQANPSIAAPSLEKGLKDYQKNINELYQQELPKLNEEFVALHTRAFYAAPPQAQRELPRPQTPKSPGS